MSRELHPVAGRWYRDLDRDEVFKVIDVDENDDLIEIQHANRELEEIESADWFEMDLERASEPDDWERDDGDDESEELDEDGDDDWRDSDDDWDDEDDENDDWDDSRDEY